MLQGQAVELEKRGIEGNFASAEAPQAERMTKDAKELSSVAFLSFGSKWKSLNPLRGKQHKIKPSALPMSIYEHLAAALGADAS